MFDASNTDIYGISFQCTDSGPSGLTLVDAMVLRVVKGRKEDLEVVLTLHQGTEDDLVGDIYQRVEYV